MRKNNNEKTQLLLETDHARIALREAHETFNYISGDEHLVESTIYDIMAKQKKYEYYIRLCRENGVCAYRLRKAGEKS